MNAETLKGFFEGAVRGSVLAEEAERTEHDVLDAENDVLTEDLSENFVITAEHLLALCDAVSRNELEPCHLEVIASVLVRSERFTWDPRSPEGALVSKVIYAWEAPEINYVLSRETVKKFARLLMTGEDTFCASDWSAIPGKNA
jgi:hypothetical protein